MVVKLTDKAKEKLRELLTTKENAKMLRLYVVGYGWGGPSFGMALDEPKDGDIELEVDGFNFLVEDSLSGVYDAFSVDYSDSWLRKGFVVSPDRGGSIC